MWCSATCALDCPAACRLRLRVEGDRVTSIEGDAAHPYTRGIICAKVRRYEERRRHPDRPLAPRRAVGPKPATRWEEVPWDVALDDIAARLRRTLADHGGEAVLPYPGSGTMGFTEGHHVLSLFRAVGATELERTLCAAAGSAGWKASYGAPVFGADPDSLPLARTVLLWGTDPVSTGLHLVPRVKAAQRAGAYVVHIDPRSTRTSRMADEHLRPRPGSDAVLAYALAHVWFERGLVDEVYLERAAEGVSAFRQEAERWSPRRAEEVTGVPVAQIRRLAERMGTEPPLFIRVGYGMTRHEGGGEALRCIALLPALVGAWQQPGGGALLSTSGAFMLDRSELGGAAFLRPGERHEGFFRPNPEVRKVNAGELGRALTTLVPPVRVLFVFGANPLVSTPDAERIRVGLQRPDLFTVVLDNALSETARYADYVLPATTFLEHPDVYNSYGHTYLGWNDRVVAAPGEARTASSVFADLARRLHLSAPALFWQAEDVARRLLATPHPWREGITFERLREDGYAPLRLPSPYLPYADGAPTATGRIRFAPPPAVRLAQPTDDYPLLLLTPPAHRFLCSGLGSVESLVAEEGGEPRLVLHPRDAAVRGVRDGDRVRVSSPLGHIVRTATVSEATREGAASHVCGWWGIRAADERPLNSIVQATPTDLGGGVAYHATHVQVERVGSGPSLPTESD